jgi:hypothetical protein
MRARLRAVTVLLAVAFAAAPVVLDQCVASCGAHAAAMTGSLPTCHHASATTERMTPMPAPCGHDHNGTVTTSADANQGARPTTTLVAPSVPSFAVTLQLAVRFNDATASPPPRSSVLALAVPLRI